MFQTETPMKEGKDGRVEIDDVDKGTVKRMLEWMYAGKVQLKNVDFNGHLDLYR